MLLVMPWPPFTTAICQKNLLQDISSVISAADCHETAWIASVQWALTCLSRFLENVKKKMSTFSPSAAILYFQLSITGWLDSHRRRVQRAPAFGQLCLILSKSFVVVHLCFAFRRKRWDKGFQVVYMLCFILTFHSLWGKKNIKALKQAEKHYLGGGGKIWKSRGCRLSTTIQ